MKAEICAICIDYPGQELFHLPEVQEALAFLAKLF